MSFRVVLWLDPSTYDHDVPVRCLSIHARYRCHHSGACCSGVFAIPAESHVVEVAATLGMHFDTRSDEQSTTVPSTPGQLVLLRQLVSELHALGLADAAIDEHGYVMATVPATISDRDVPVIGFIAHVKRCSSGSPTTSSRSIRAHA